MIVKQERDISSVVDASREDFAPLSFPQERLLFMNGFGGLGSAYNIPAAVRLQGELNIILLSRAFTEIIRRHAALRTRFEIRDGVGMQIVGPPWAMNLTCIDVCELAVSAYCLI